MLSNQNELLSIEDAAEYLDVSVEELELWANNRPELPQIISYRIGDLHAFLLQKSQTIIGNPYFAAKLNYNKAQAGRLREALEKGGFI